MMGWMVWAVSAGHAQGAESVAEHGGGAHGGIHEAPNLITLLNATCGDVAIVQFLHQWENAVFAFLIIGCIVWLARAGTRHMAKIPVGTQNIVELLAEQLDEFTTGIMGHAGRHFTPFVGTLFLYIICMNLAGMIPLMKSPTASFNMTLALAICVFCYVQYTGIRRLGLKQYVLHLLGEPKDVVGWLLAPLMGLLELLGEFVKPISLALRLFANILAEDAMLGAFLLLGATALAALHSPIGIPFHTLLYPLVLLFSTIQALVFCMLTCVYLSMKLPHGS
jgi:F-type H+-transporting ATPase subunit a